MKAGKNMKSILDANALDDFIDSAELGGQDFEVARVHQNHAFLVQATTHQSIQALDFSEFKAEQLSIPRKPQWNKDMSAEDVDRNEKSAFLTWRREIAGIESKDNYTQKVTPFEKNLEVWRQLWRVCERSDIIVQIVDGRNPLLYYTADLRKYVQEMKPTRMMMLIINKSDFLTEYQRVIWSEYLTSLGIFFVFYSAHNEQEILDHMDVNDEVSDDVDAKERDEILAIADNLVNHYLGVKDTSTAATSSTIGSNSSFDISNYICTEQIINNNKDSYQGGHKLNPNEIIEEEEEEEETDDDDDDEVSEDDSDVNNSDSNNKPIFPASAVVTPQVPALESELPVVVEVEVADNDEDEDTDEILMKLVQGKKMQLQQQQQEKDILEEDIEEDEDDNSDDDNDDDLIEKKTTEVKKINKLTDTFSDVSLSIQNQNISIQQRHARVLTRSELLILFYSVAQKLKLSPQTRHDGRICIGLVGYPNVGKSSVINTLLGVSKSTHGRVRVGVSSTPGKTKHFQTLIVTDSLMLCDCPGLVFPSFMRSTGEMLCAGILPINQMRDYQEPGNVIASRIPQYLLEASLGIKIYRHLDPLDKRDRPPTPTEILSAYCQSKGYITNGTGRWDEFRACKDLLKCFTEGKILHVAIPPITKDHTTATTTTTASNEINLTNKSSAMEEIILKRWIKETERVMIRKLRVAERVDEQQQYKIKKALKDDKLRLEQENEFIFEYDAALDDTILDEGEVDQSTTKVVDINGYEFVDDDSDDDDLHLINGDDTSNNTTTTNIKREHKRLPHWGKKNRKLRNKDPYGENSNAGVSNYIAYSTNRTAKPITTTTSTTINSNNVNNKLMRNNIQHPYGTPYVRTILPHHQL